MIYSDAIPLDSLEGADLFLRGMFKNISAIFQRTQSIEPIGLMLVEGLIAVEFPLQPIITEIHQEEFAEILRQSALSLNAIAACYLTEATMMVEDKKMEVILLMVDHLAWKGESKYFNAQIIEFEGKEKSLGPFEPMPGAIGKISGLLPRKKEDVN